jgi:hypothetical protein
VLLLDPAKRHNSPNHVIIRDVLQGEKQGVFLERIVKARSRTSIEEQLMCFSSLYGPEIDLAERFVEGQA